MTYPDYQKSVLPNGLTLVTERIPYVRSVSVGVWIRTGTRYESAGVNGVAHFLEHMMFKETERRSARDIARNIESLGGSINAFTSKEQTCFHVEILDEYLDDALSVLSDILSRHRFPELEFQKERFVILDEIQSVEDTPDDKIHDVFVEELFPEHGLGYPILGTPDTVGSLTIEEMLDFYRREYTAGNIVIAAAGNLDHQRMAERVATLFHFPGDGPAAVIAPPERFGSGEVRIERPIQQGHLCLGVPAMSYTDPRRWNLLVLNTILGGGMGSRLFQNIREEHGIAYSIYSYFDFYIDSGVMGAYLGCDPKNIPTAMELLYGEFDHLVKTPVTAAELAEAKSQLKGNIVLGLETAAARMNRLATLEMFLGMFRSLDDIIMDIDAVTAEGVQETARQLFAPERFLTVLLAPAD